MLFCFRKKNGQTVKKISTVYEDGAVAQSNFSYCFARFRKVKADLKDRTLRQIKIQIQNKSNEISAILKINRMSVVRILKAPGYLNNYDGLMDSN